MKPIIANPSLVTLRQLIDISTDLSAEEVASFATCFNSLKAASILSLWTLHKINQSPLSMLIQSVSDAQLAVPQESLDEVIHLFSILDPTLYEPNTMINLLSSVLAIKYKMGDKFTIASTNLLNRSIEHLYQIGWSKDRITSATKGLL